MELIHGTTLWFWILLVVLLFVAYWYVGGPRDLPPGSAGLPIVGYLPFIEKLSFLTFEKLGQKYGDVFHLYLGSRLVVILNDYSSIHEAFIKKADIFSGRPPDNVFKESANSINLGITSNDGEYWKQHRRFILNNLKNNGFGKSNLELLILDEIGHFTKEFRKHAGRVMNIKPLLQKTISNNINILVTGKRLDYTSLELWKLVSSTNKVTRATSVVGLNAFFPWLAALPGSDRILKRKETRNCMDHMNNVIAEIIHPTKDKYIQGQDENYIHAFMTEKNRQIKANGTEDVFTDLSLLHNARTLLLAGTETTATTLLFTLLCMTLNPEIQKKVQIEIDAIIGRERLPSYSDRKNMPYTEATILETFRKGSLIPLSIPHRARKAVRIQGHNIPKDTMVIPNIWGVHHDNNFWGDPHTFRPERFIGSDGQLVKSERILTFSIGKRSCIGEPLARMEIFLYFVSILQNFTLIPPNGVQLNLECYPGLVIQPKCENICAVLRD